MRETPLRHIVSSITNYVRTIILIIQVDISEIGQQYCREYVEQVDIN